MVGSLLIGGLNGPFHSAAALMMRCVTARKNAPAGPCLIRFLFSIARSIQSDRATSRRPVDCLVTLTVIFAATLRYVLFVYWKLARLLTLSFTM